jgi:hypothetical protein
MNLRFAAVLALLLLLSHFSLGEVVAQVERYKSETEYLARLAELGYEVVAEGFETVAWDDIRSPHINDTNSQPSVVSHRLVWEAAGLDLWSYPTSRVHGVTTNHNWARSGSWGLFEDHVGDPIPTTIRVTAPEPVYGIGGWFNTNPDGDDFGFLFENETIANAPGYVLPKLGAMYPGDNAGSGHNFAGIIDPRGFTSVVLTGTLELNEEDRLEGGIIYGADDFTLAVPIGFLPSDTTGDFDGDARLTAVDIDLLATQVRSGQYEGKYDLDLDGVLDGKDQARWVHVEAQTSFGDANLDGEFNSGDLVTVFQAGEYEDAVEDNSGWADGDWDGDGDFTSGDLVLAFKDGGYEQGPQDDVNAVPEPSSFAMLMAALISVAGVSRSRGKSI